MGMGWILQLAGGGKSVCSCCGDQMSIIASDGI